MPRPMIKYKIEKPKLSRLEDLGISYTLNMARSKSTQIRHRRRKKSRN